MKSKLIMLAIIANTFHLVAQSTQNPYESYGVMHNDGCKRVLQSLSVIPALGTCKPIVESVLKPVWGDVYFANYASIPEFTSYPQLLAYFNARVSVRFSNEVAGWDSFLANNPSFDAIQTRVNQKVAQVPQLVPQNEANIYYIYLSTLKHSSKFWLPVSKGGENGASFGPLIENVGDPQNLTKWQWDALGAGTGALVGGPAGALGGAVLASTAAWVASFWD